jgi:hypothetical protein
MNILLFILLTFIGLAAIGFLISLHYRKKPVNIEKAKVNLTYMAVSYTSILATLGLLGIVDNNIELIHSWMGSTPLTSRDIVNFTFAFVLIIPMMALFSIFHWKKKELKKEKESKNSDL